MTKLTESERLVKLETQVESAIGLLNEIKTDNKEFRVKLENLLPSYATAEQLELIEKKLEDKISQSKSSRLKDLIIQALIIGPISALIGFFFANITRG